MLDYNKYEQLSMMDEKVSLMVKCQVSQSLLISLYELNSTEMSAMLSVLPKNFQVQSTLMFVCVVGKICHSEQYITELLCDFVNVLQQYNLCGFDYS